MAWHRTRRSIVLADSRGYEEKQARETSASSAFAVNVGEATMTVNTKGRFVRALSHNSVGIAIAAAKCETRSATPVLWIVGVRARRNARFQKSFLISSSTKVSYPFHFDLYTLIS